MISIVLSLIILFILCLYTCEHDTFSHCLYKNESLLYMHKFCHYENEKKKI